MAPPRQWCQTSQLSFFFFCRTFFPGPGRVRTLPNFLPNTMLAELFSPGRVGPLAGWQSGSGEDGYDGAATDATDAAEVHEPGQLAGCDRTGATEHRCRAAAADDQVELGRVGRLLLLFRKTAGLRCHK